MDDFDKEHSEWKYNLMKNGIPKKGNEQQTTGLLDKRSVVQMLEWVGAGMFLVGGFAIFIGLLVLTGGGLPAYGAFVIIGSGIACMFQGLVLAGFEFVVLAAIKYLESHKTEGQG